MRSRWLGALLWAVCSLALAGDVTLTWLAPDRNVDGSVLNNLAGFNIFWGERSGEYSYVWNIADPSIRSFTFTDLPNGASFYFVMTAYNANSEESSYSNEILKVVPGPERPGKGRLLVSSRAF